MKVIPIQPMIDPFDAYHARLCAMFQDLSWAERPNGLYVAFLIRKTIWDSYKKNGLGQLYGVDLGNYLSRQGILKRYAVPVVDDKKNARGGLKRIVVNYYWGND